VTVPTASSSQLFQGADVDPTARIGSDTRIWSGAQVREGATIGHSCVVGRNAYVGSGVQIGDCCKLQNHALVYEPAVLEDGVFIGPSVVLTNDRHPRAITPEGQLKSSRDWDAVGVTVRYGASVGAGAICVAPVELGRWCLVAAGSVVVRDVPDFALVAGNPARQIGWVGRAAVPLRETETGLFVCPETGQRYRERFGCLAEVHQQDTP
jgi:UDP-2-acetamido-3-amino-2,3-dideoxy-glucuronate N-acetyltransferase